jgi:hypothetical protein
VADGELKIINLKKNESGYKIGQAGKQLLLDIRWPYEIINCVSGHRFVTIGMDDGSLQLKLPMKMYDYIEALSRD